MRAARSVNLADRGQSRLIEALRQLRERGPEPSMHVGDRSFHKPADKNVRRCAHGTDAPKNLVRLGVSPITAPNGFARHSRCQVWNRAARRFQNDSLLLDKSQRLFGGHADRMSHQKDASIFVLDAESRVRLRGKGRFHAEADPQDRIAGQSRVPPKIDIARSTAARDSWNRRSCRAYISRQHGCGASDARALINSNRRKQREPRPEASDSLFPSLSSV